MKVGDRNLLDLGGSGIESIKYTSGSGTRERTGFQKELYIEMRTTVQKTLGSPNAGHTLAAVSYMLLFGQVIS